MPLSFTQQMKIAMAVTTNEIAATTRLISQSITASHGLHAANQPHS